MEKRFAACAFHFEFENLFANKAEWWRRGRRRAEKLFSMIELERKIKRPPHSGATAGAACSHSMARSRKRALTYGSQRSELEKTDWQSLHGSSS